jgi:hypothetical protein
MTMAFEHHEDLSPKGQGRVLNILTTENVMAALIGAIIGFRLVTWAGAATFSILTFGAILLGAGIGIVLTFRFGGLSLLDRVILRQRLRTARWIGSNIVEPSGSSRTTRPDLGSSLTVSRDGKVIARSLRLDERTPESGEEEESYGVPTY